MTEFYAAERWLPIAGFEGLYEVSDFGRVRSLDRIVESRNHPLQKKRLLRGRILAQRVNKPTSASYKRMQVKLYKENKLHTFNVARLVAQAFIPNPKKHPFVLHLDDDATNNKIDNLEWGTHEENVRQAAERNRMKYGQEHHHSFFSDVDRRMAYEMLEAGEARVFVASKFKVSYRAICDLANGSIKGYSKLDTIRQNTRGDKNKNSLLTEDEAMQIKIKLKQKAKCCDLAKEYSVSPSTISAIKRGVNWWWLEIEQQSL